MITKDEFLATIQHEVDIIKNLATNMPVGGLTYRPSPDQRSMLDLMQYLTYASILPLTYNISGNWDKAEHYFEGAKSVNADNFASRMDAQMQEIRELVDATSSASMNDASSQPWQEPITRGRGFIDMGLKSLVAYRMQFFLYLKAAGAAQMTSYECWIGKNTPKEKASAAS